MRIKLKNAWFSPAGSLLRRGEHEVPEDWKKQLPSGATVLEEPKPEPKSKKSDEPKLDL